jgi:HlyD family secretion protein
MRAHRILPVLFPILLDLISCGGERDAVFSGSIEIDEIRVSARVGGTVEELTVGSGDAVIAGQVLVRLDNTEYELAMRQAEAALDIAGANLETLLEGARQQEIVSASSSVESAGAQFEQASDDLARAEELTAAGALSQQSLDAARTFAVQRESVYLNALQAYSLTMEGPRLTEIRAASAAVESADAAAAMAARRLEWTEVESAVSGTVTGTFIMAGENVSAGTTLLTVSDTDTVTVVFYLSQQDLASVSTGDSVSVCNGSVDGVFVTGVINSISESAEFTPSRVETRDGRTSLVYRTEAVLPNPGEIFRAGMPVDVRMAGSP